MAADFSHLLSVDAKKHKYEETLKDEYMIYAIPLFFVILSVGFLLIE